MTRALSTWLGISVILTTAACGGSADTPAGGGSAEATIADRTFAVSHVEMTFETGGDGFFRIEGEDAANPGKDCLPGLGGGVALYGDLPSTITSLADLTGQELPFDFSGDGDDANLCFVGTNGLLGVEEGTVRFTAVDGNRVSFTFSGSFKVYDGEGGESAAPISASGSGIAHVSR